MFFSGSQAGWHLLLPALFWGALTGHACCSVRELIKRLWTWNWPQIPAASLESSKLLRPLIITLPTLRVNVGIQ